MASSFKYCKLIPLFISKYMPYSLAMMKMCLCIAMSVSVALVRELSNHIQ